MATGNVPLDFTDGDLFKRFTVTDPLLIATENPPQLTIRRYNVADNDDAGWTFIPQIVSMGQGTMDVTVAVLDWNDPQPVGDTDGPNEVVSLIYSIS